MFYVIFLGIPLAIILFFITSLGRYCVAKIRNKKNPESYSKKEVKKRLILLIVSFLMAAVFVSTVAWIIVELEKSVAYM